MNTFDELILSKTYRKTMSILKTINTSIAKDLKLYSNILPKVPNTDLKNLSSILKWPHNFCNVANT